VAVAGCATPTYPSAIHGKYHAREISQRGAPSIDRSETASRDGHRRRAAVTEAIGCTGKNAAGEPLCHLNAMQAAAGMV
jgi:hypothetical protein